MGDLDERHPIRRSHDGRRCNHHRCGSACAPKLGLSVEVLKAEMRRGYVYSVTEQGIGSDAGWTRLTFRYRARSWCVLVYPDGTLVEGPATAPAPPSVARRSWRRDHSATF